MRFLHKAAALGWWDLCAVAPGPTWDAWQALTFHPTESESRSRHHPLRLEYAVHVIDGVPLEQWQYEVTAGGRIWFCADPKTRTVWITYASPKHPKATE